MRRLSPLFLLTTFFTLTLLIWPNVSHADSPLVVNSTADAPDANPSDGLCQTATPGECTLRAALMESNADTSLTHTITFSLAGSGPHTITPGSALPIITHPLTLDGLTAAGATCTTPQIEIDGVNVPAILNLTFPPQPANLTPPIGLHLQANNSLIRGLVINNFNDTATTGPPLNIETKAGIGILIDTSQNNRLECNFLGTEPDGLTASPNQVGLSLGNASHNHISRNLISGNGENGTQTAGVLISVEPNNALTVSHNALVSNTIGLDVSGTVAVGNQQDGILLINARQTLISGNLIAGNGDDGLDITDVAAVSFAGFSFSLTCPNPPCATENLIQFNQIGLTVDGSLIGNGDSGVQVEDSQKNTVAHNTIAGNGKHGVEVDDLGGGNCTKGASPCAIENTIRANSIFSNTALGIDLTGGTESDFVTANDAADSDSGSNGLQNYPVLTTALALTESNTLKIGGVLTSQAESLYTLEFFVNPACDPSGFGEGGRFIISDSLTTDSAGVGVFSLTATLPLSNETWLVATATDASGNTSEFSACRAIVPPAPVAPPVSHTLQVDVLGSGTVTPTGGTYLSGTVVSLTTQADLGWQFAGWGGDLGGTAVFTALVMTAPKLVTATFTLSPVDEGWDVYLPLILK